MHVTPSIRLLVNKTNNGVFGITRVLRRKERDSNNGVEKIKNHTHHKNQTNPSSDKQETIEN
jgi:antitoxin component of MazEF toxin-antitoxin module